MYKGKLEEDRIRQLRMDQYARAAGVVVGWSLIVGAMGALLGWPGALLVVGLWMTIPARYIQP